MIAADQRHRGIGGALLDHAVARYARPTLWTSTNQSNAPMQALLLARGFQPSGQIEGLDEGDPELFFRISRV